MRAKNFLGIIALLVSTSAIAQTERSGNADARVMQQLQQLSAERTQLKADNDRMKKELDEAKQQLTKLQGEQTGLKQKADASAVALARASSSGEATTQQLETVRGQLQELVGKFRETAQTLRDVETDRSTAKSELGIKQRELNQCIDRNAEMFVIAGETLDRLSRRGSFSAFTDHEPFTQLSRTRLDNLVEDYRYRVEELRVEKNAASNKTR